MPLDSSDQSMLLTVCMLMYVSLAAASIVILENEEDEGNDRSKRAMVVAGLQAFRRLDKRRRRLEAEELGLIVKRPRVKYDYLGARACLVRDYLGPDGLFERYFERVFRVSRSIVEQLIQICGTCHSFFTETTNKVTGEPGIFPEVKVMLAIKVLAFGVAPAAFMDYFQMSEQTGRKCVKIFCRVLCQHPQIRRKYLREMSKSDAMRVSAMHKTEFGVRGCVGCLDCMHVYWKNCPVSWKGQYQGKEGYPTIILEAVADYSLWIWHARFGFPGTLNDINVWDQSSLLRTFLDGSFASTVDFPYRVAGKTFNKLWILVDGIYPELTRFIRTISVPMSRPHKMFAKWQEACRKAVERAFGVLQRKFQILTKPLEFFYEEDIRNVVETCIVLHNMMVETRVRRNEEESLDWYVAREEEDEAYEVPLLLSNVPPVVPKPPTVKERIDEVALQWPDEQAHPERAAVIKALLADHFTNLQDEWRALYDRQKHYELRDAIIEQLILNVTTATGP